MDMTLNSFEEFWPYYMSLHAKAGTRALHFVGTTAAVVLLLSAAVLRRPRLVLAAPVAAYSLAWFSHFFIERNAPATFRYPLYSLRADFRMWALTWRGLFRRPA
jgi:hypothetical protein